MGSVLGTARNTRHGYLPAVLDCDLSKMVKGKEDPYTAILVQSEVSTGFPAPNEQDGAEEISLSLSSCNLEGLRGFKMGMGAPQLDSPSDCTTLSTISTMTATPLDQKHRFHLFFAYNTQDKAWVEEVVERLEDEPYNYRCCYADRDFDDKVTHLQNILCSIMLSQRVIVVLSPCFVEESWVDYEEGIAHLTSLSQRRQRVIPVLLKECTIPDSLRMSQPIDVRHESFWDVLFQSLQIDGLPYSASLHTIRSLSSQSSGFYNGQLLVTLSATIEGFCRSHLLFDYEEVPDPLAVHDVMLSRQEYAEIVKLVGREDVGIQLSWLFSALPTILLAILFVLWCVAFILVIILFPDDSPSTLPVRLCVFSLPAAAIVIGCVLRWKKLKSHKEKFSMCMFSRSVQVNQMLYEKSKSVIITSARTHDDTFHQYFIYFNRTDCIERIKLFLTHCSDEDTQKLQKLIDVYTLNSGYLEGRPLAVRIAVMMSSSYAINLVFKRIPHSLEQRHTRRRQCLCQFVEEFLAAYMPCIRQETDVNNVRHVFYRYLNCQFKPDPVILHTLGISTLET